MERDSGAQRRNNLPVAAQLVRVGVLNHHTSLSSGKTDSPGAAGGGAPVSFQGLTGLYALPASEPHLLRRSEKHSEMQVFLTPARLDSSSRPLRDATCQPLIVIFTPCWTVWLRLVNLFNTFPSVFPNMATSQAWV